MVEKQARKMVNLDIDETSGVDHPAHFAEGWLVMKSAGESDVQGVFDESLTEEEPNMGKETSTATEGNVEKSADDALAKANARIAELESQLADAKKEDKAEGDVSKSVDPSEEFLKSAPTEVVEMFEKMRKESEDKDALVKSANDELQKERDLQADKESIEKAKGWKNLNLDAQKIGPALRKLSGIDPELAKSLDVVLSSLNAQAETSNIFAELGKSVDGASGDNAYGTMEALAKSLVESNSATSMQDAMAQVAKNRPDLYDQYTSEKKGH